MSEIKVMLVGASRSGKTSILASMMRECNNKLGNYNLQLDGLSNTSFRNSISEMQDLCDSENSNERMPPLRGNQDVTEYRFALSYLNAKKAGSTTITVYDIPGEIFEDESRIRDVETYATECQIIIVAIDTPAMLWLNGNRRGQRYQEIVCCTTALQRLVNNLGTAIDEDREENNKCLKTIIFVPIKCEHLLHSNSTQFKMDIEQVIKGAYADILEMNRIKLARCKVSIIPMETIGGVIFTKYSEADKMKVLYYDSNKVFGPEDENKSWEDEDNDVTQDGDIRTKKITRCENINTGTVRIARTGMSYALQEGDELKPTSERKRYPYVYDQGKAIPYIWYRPTGDGYQPKNCINVLYEIIKIAIQQIAADSNKDINDILEGKLGFWEKIIDIIFGNATQRQELCKSLKAMTQDKVFDNSIIIQNNIDNDYSTKLKIRI